MKLSSQKAVSADDLLKVEMELLDVKAEKSIMAVKVRPNLKYFKLRREFFKFGYIFLSLNLGIFSCLYLVTFDGK